MGEKLTVYSKESCVQCTATYRGLDSIGAEYDVVDLSTVPDEQIEQWRRDGLLQAPIVETSSEVWSGYRPDKINQLGRIGIDLVR